jgi:transcriptional regulator with XRE-family HTH domain
MTELPGQLADPGRYLRAQRELADVSRNTLARLARVSESYLTQVEKGQEEPTPEVLTAISEFDRELLAHWDTEGGYCASATGVPSRLCDRR